MAGAPSRRVARSTQPSWHLPCGQVLSAEPGISENLEDEVRTTLQNLQLQHQLTMNDYLNRDYDYLYERVRIGVHDHQYIPNWVPGKKDVNRVKNLVRAKPQQVKHNYILILF